MNSAAFFPQKMAAGRIAGQIQAGKIPKELHSWLIAEISVIIKFQGRNVASKTALIKPFCFYRPPPLAKFFLGTKKK